MPDFPLTDDGTVTLTLEPVEDGLRVEVAEETDGYRVVYSANKPHSFVGSDQIRGLVGNKIRDHLSNHFDEEAVVEKFNRICSQINAGDLSEEQKRRLKAPAVQRLIDETVAVDVFPAEEATFRVTLERDGERRELEFSQGEWVADSPAPLKQQYAGAFYDRLAIGKDEWVDLVEYWSERQEVHDREELTARDTVLGDVIRGLRKNVKPMANREALENDRYAAWYDVDGRMVDSDTQIPDDGPILWVRSDALTHQIDEAGKERTFLAQLSQMLRDEGATYSTSREKADGILYPFVPEELGVTDPELDVAASTDENDTEVAP